jgi:GT2 family glycosyltransferase
VARPPRNDVMAKIHISHQKYGLLRLSLDALRQSQSYRLCLLADGQEITSRTLHPPFQGTQYLALPLPETLNDGQTHLLTVTLSNPEDSTLPLAQVETFYVFQGIGGRVAIHGTTIVGHVAFTFLPQPAPVLEIVDENDQLQKTLPLILLEGNTPGVLRQASFRISVDELRLPARFLCCGVELMGSPCALPQRFLGLVEPLSWPHLSGWAADMLHLHHPVQLVLEIDGIPIRTFRPNRRLPALAQYLGLPEDHVGIVGFDLALPSWMGDGHPHRVDVRFAGTREPLQGSPQTITVPVFWEEIQRPAPRPRHHASHSPQCCNPHVSIIVLNRNGAELLDAMFSSWEEHNTFKEVEFLVIDHGSTDESLLVLSRWQRRIALRILAVEDNDSFSRSCNRGAQLARGNYLLFLNNDIVWLHDALPQMVDTLASQPQIAAVGIKLMKTPDGAPLRMPPEVQHLGIRFVLSGPAYWPYEITPEPGEREYDAQEVPAVTGAVLLCRRQEFLDSGGFHPDYFYGFEDVEFCLRLAARTGKRILCRNDLLALHRHGHTRLSGRALDTLPGIERNADVLQRHMGLWLKRVLWKALLQGDHLWTRERLTFGLVCDGAPGASSPLRRAMEALGKRLLARFPHARVRLLTPGKGWYTVRDIHVLVVGTPEYEANILREWREDILTVAWIRDNEQHWRKLPWKNDLMLWVSPRPQVVARLRQQGIPIHLASTAMPLGPHFHSDLLRIAILYSPAEGQTYEMAHNLCHQLRSQGAAAWVEDLDAPGSDLRLAHARIWVSQNGSHPPHPLPHTLNGAWLLKPTTLPGWKIWHQMPRLDAIVAWQEEVLGHTFCAS